MAFFCPVRMRKGKKKKGKLILVTKLQKLNTTIAAGDSDPLTDGKNAPIGGRITGSSSIETLVRVGLEKENGLTSDSKMVILHNFIPCVDDELEVKRGQVVSVLYQENDWVYVITEDNSAEGFIPASYCTLASGYWGQMVKSKKIPRNLMMPNELLSIHSNQMKNQILSNHNGLMNGHHQLNPNSVELMLDSYSSVSVSASDSIHPFFKDPAGKYVVIYSFVARDENDVSVERGEFVTVLNKDDPEWYWIIRSDGHEGFVPASFVCPMDINISGKNQTCGHQ